MHIIKFNNSVRERFILVKLAAIDVHILLRLKAIDILKRVFKESEEVYGVSDSIRFFCFLKLLT